MSPIDRTYSHRFIPSKMRATLGSVESLIGCLAGIIATPFVGFLMDKIGGKYTVLILGGLMIPIIILYLMIKEPEKK
jgi:nitrate/nitrite transporter NarK